MKDETMASTERALQDLAGGMWITRHVRPSVSLTIQPRLFETTLRDRFLVHYPAGRPYWPDDSRIALDCVIEDPIHIPFLEVIGISWCAPCHALLSFDGQLVSSVTGILTFEAWTEVDEYTGFFDLEDFDSSPQIAALSSSLEMETEQRHRALENALQLVYDIECADSSALLDALDTRDDWSR